MIGDVNIKDDGVIISINIDSSTLVVEIPSDSWSRMGLSQREIVHGYMRLRDLRGCRIKTA